MASIGCFIQLLPPIKKFPVTPNLFEFILSELKPQNWSRNLDDHSKIWFDQIRSDSIRSDQMRFNPIIEVALFRTLLSPLMACRNSSAAPKKVDSSCMIYVASVNVVCPCACVGNFRGGLKSWQQVRQSSRFEADKLQTTEQVQFWFGLAQFWLRQPNINQIKQQPASKQTNWIAETSKQHEPKRERPREWNLTPLCVAQSLLDFVAPIWLACEPWLDSFWAIAIAFAACGSNGSAFWVHLSEQARRLFGYLFIYVSRRRCRRFKANKLTR